MSLLLDALKKSEEARLSNQSGLSNQPGQSNQSNSTATSFNVTPAPQGDNELTLEALPQASAHEAAASDRKTAIELGSVRVAAHNLFAAKVAPKSNKIKLGIVPIAIIAGLFLASAGGIYIWLETAIPPTPQVPHRMAIVPTASIATTENLVVDTPLPTKIEPTTSSHIPQGDNEGTMSTSQSNRNKSAPISAAFTQKSGTRSSTPSAANTAQSTQVPAPPAESTPLLMFKPHVNNISTQLADAYRAYRAGNMITATELYQAILQQDTKNRDALLGMAAVAQQQQNDGLAIQYYSQVLALDPRDPAAYAAMSALNLSDPSSAESHLKLLIPHRPHAGILYFALGNVYAEQSRWGDAQQAYFNAVNREMENAQFNFNLAVSLDHLGQNELAAQYYQRAMQLEQTGATSFNHAAAQQRLQELATP